ncbi:ABC transporter permease [Streptomyces sp. NPDC057474]|uniref:ABC transporter permease n=1 Tax=Streptomyces sp. NPDC057474 TaxID=3346144 RepID=UPI00368DBFC1
MRPYASSGLSRGKPFVTVLVVVTLTFFVLHAFSGDIAASLSGNTATAAQIEVKRHQLGLDKPLVSQYGEWLSHAVRGDLGTSWTTSDSVSDALSARLPVTLVLAVGATLVSGVLGIAVGTWAAVRRGALDPILQTFVVAGYAFPGFWLALVLSSVFAVDLGWFPATGYVPFTESPGDWFSSVFLPITALVLGATAAIAQQARNATVQVLQADYVRTLRSRGLTTRRLLVVNVLRNAAPTSLTTMSLWFIGLLSGTIVVENVFALPGLGSLANTATTSRDIPMVMGVMLIMVLLVVAVNLVLDLAQAWVNPKVRIS